MIGKDKIHLFNDQDFVLVNGDIFSEKKKSIHPQFDNLENSNKTFLSNPRN